MYSFRIDSQVSGLAKYFRKGRRKKGLFVAITDPRDSNHIICGYSMCHPSDRFSKAKAIDIAYGRSIKWDSLSKTFYRVPDSMKVELRRFLQRAKSYFKDKTISTWVINELNEECVIVCDSKETHTGGFIMFNDEEGFFDRIRDIANA